MSQLAKLVISKGREGRKDLSDLVMAWARDSATGQPRYILELDDAHRGSKCGCECPSCGRGLTAVNAAKSNVKRRPHFRHPKGAERKECLILAARAAVLDQLLATGWLELPRRSKSAKAVGLSGQFYEAWVDLPSETLQIRHMDYRDRAAAIITFDDGRQLRVDLTGTPGSSSDAPGPDGLVVPTVFVHVDDAALAGLSGDEIRQRMQLIPDALCWHSHWKDSELEGLARTKAHAQAMEYLDEWPDGLDWPHDLDPALRRETVLHLEVKRILQDHRCLQLPGLVVRVEAQVPEGDVLQAQWDLPAEMFELDHVELEQRHGRLIPDVTCKAWPVAGGRVYWPLHIEVTVTNPITEERLKRIRAHGQPTVEINLSLAGGWVSRDMLKQLVIEGLSIKRWLFHPDEAVQRQALVAQLEQKLTSKVAAQAEQERQAAQRRAWIKSRPLTDIARDFLNAAMHTFDNGAAGLQARARDEGLRPADDFAPIGLDDAIDMLRLRGYPEAGDDQFCGWHGILSRILSFKLGRPVGYQVENVMGVLNAISLGSVKQKSMYSLYLIAVRVFKPPLSEQQWQWFEQWATDVRESIKRGEQTYLRDTKYDRLLSLLFPEMAASLSKRAGKRSTAARAGLSQEQRALHKPVSGWLMDTRPSDEWLTGRDLEAWERAHPEALRLLKPDKGN